MVGVQWHQHDLHCVPVSQCRQHQVEDALAFRLINGGGNASIALNSSIIVDVLVQQECGLALAIVGLPPLLGPTTDPVLGGFLTQAEDWRWAFWLSAITGVCVRFVS